MRNYPSTKFFRPTIVRYPVRINIVYSILNRVTQISCSPAESVFVSAASNATYGTLGASAGSLISWNLKTMQKQQTFELEGSEASSVINTVQYNHNGQLLVSGNDQGFIRIFGRLLTT
jgi:WD40 repeat protein